MFVRARHVGSWRPRRLVACAAVLASLVAAGSVGAAKPSSAVVSGVQLSGCNLLEFGQVIGDRMKKLGDNSGSECNTKTLRDFKLHYDSSSFLKLYLTDVTCGQTYFSDGTGGANHVTLTNAGDSDRLDMADAGGDCSIAGTNFSPGVGQGNLTLLVTPAGALS